MTSGREVFRQLARATRDARANTDQTAERLRRKRAAVDNLVGDRTERLLELARHYFPSLEQSSIDAVADPTGDGSVAALRAELQRVHAEREARIEELARLAADADALRQREDQAIQELTEELDALVAQRETLEAEVTARLEADEEFAALANRAAETEARLHRDEERAKELQWTASEKLPAYEQSVLFRYLVRRQFGSNEYSSRGLIRRLDQWVARVCHFRENKPSYDFLRVTPEIVEAEVERRRADFDQLMEQVEAREQAIEDELGLTEVRTRGDKVGAQRDRRVQTLAEAQSRLVDAESERMTLERSEGEHYAQALERFRRFLDHAEHDALRERAAQTKEPKDDRIVAEIGTISDTLAELRPAVERLVEDRREHNDRSAELELLSRRFREANFDATRSYFEDLDLEAGLSDLSAGRTDADSLWQVLRRKQKFRPMRRPSRSRRSRQRATSRSGGLGGMIDDLNADWGDAAGVLMDVMGGVVRGTLRNAARRSVQRRRSGGGFNIDFGGFGRGGGSSSSGGGSRRRSSGRSSGGFTTGGGF